MRAQHIWGLPHPSCPSSCSKPSWLHSGVLRVQGDPSTTCGSQQGWWP